MTRIHFASLCAFAAIWCVVVACERPIDLDIDLPEPRLVVNGNFQPNELLQITVSRSQYVLDNDPNIEYIAHALVEVTEEGGVTERLRYVPLDEREYNYPYYETRGLKPEVGKSYTIRVKVPDSEFEEVTAHSMIPEPVEIRLFQVYDPVILVGATAERVRYEYSIDFDFVDPPDKTNHYHINFRQEVHQFYIENGDTIITGSTLLPVHFTSEDDTNNRESYMGSGILLEDNPYTGGLSFRVGVEINPSKEKLGNVKVELRTVSEEYYQYHRSINRQLNSSEGLGTHVTIFNNIENGHGIFAGFSSQQESAVLPPIN